MAHLDRRLNSRGGAGRPRRADEQDAEIEELLAEVEFPEVADGFEGCVWSKCGRVKLRMAGSTKAHLPRLNAVLARRTSRSPDGTAPDGRRTFRPRPAMLEFERLTWKYPGAKQAAIVERFG